MEQVEPEKWMYFKDSPDAGDPACLCSICVLPIAEDTVPLRVFFEANGRTLECRFCEGCKPKALPVIFDQRQWQRQLLEQPSLSNIISIDRKRNN